MTNWKKVIFPIFLLFFTLVIDGGVSFLFREQLITSEGFIIPRLVVITLIMLSFYLEPKQLFILAFSFGFIYDSYYSGVLGIYIAAFIVIQYVIVQIRQIINPNFFLILLVNIVSLTLMELFVFGGYRVIGLTDMTLQMFLVNRLSGTLILNACIFLIVGYPLQEWIQTLAAVDESKSGTTKI
ncbi:MAG: rod shape-determining protein MreD [Alkalibacterium gilvum]|uniref:Rod shape-determining protein MreD n=1 Tax=Alkalibacterium gilvum TaxID=1130080 RepID=A0A1H6UYX5_9LACT|nr:MULTISPECIES: rod shape-determining protein MreD [Alkalibacterium]MDN6293219.1 rod shape-determining protein MreD [Alkalibacterium sp.]MDN6295265.1 rod shape-determining protein MreD [Alkalibacterium sp.]MDN6385356.1 rod shape-determining protein MreD [Alkalibacterium sp.]MDN6398117.1 rod shape-determining protein MreD [Alkalibacterium sp.]SEI93202.1 rod shape-determining protein MreD [Alkalibacterium gilvum]